MKIITERNVIVDRALNRPKKFLYRVRRFLEPTICWCRKGNCYEEDLQGSSDFLAQDFQHKIGNES
jgi:hypothetical protein